MKISERNASVELRQKGWALKKIAEHLGVSRGSVSYWVRGIVVPPISGDELRQKRFLGDEKRRTTIFEKTTALLRDIEQDCLKEVKAVSKRDLFIAGIMLYAGEGAKHKAPHSQRVEFTNADISITQIFVRFLVECCSVQKEDIRLRLFLYEDMNEEAAKRFWADNLRIPLSQFVPVQTKKRVGGLPSRKAQNGTMHVLVYNKRLFQRIVGWTKAFHGTLSGCGLIG
ncbi:MAG: hypothetical protein AAB606_01130 [Patescibacteria group bacterium]